MPSIYLSWRFWVSISRSECKWVFLQSGFPLRTWTSAAQFTCASTIHSLGYIRYTDDPNIPWGHAGIPSLRHPSSEITSSPSWCTPLHPFVSCAALDVTSGWLRICPVWREGEEKKQRSKCQRHQPGVKLPAATPKPICMRKSGCLKARSSSELAVFIVCWTKTALTTWAGKNQSAIGGYSHVWHSTNGRFGKNPFGQINTGMHLANEGLQRSISPSVQHNEKSSYQSQFQLVCLRTIENHGLNWSLMNNLLLGKTQRNYWDPPGWGLVKHGANFQLTKMMGWSNHVEPS